MGLQFGQAVNPPFQKRIEVDDVRRANLEKPGWIALAPAVERCALESDDFRGEARSCEAHRAEMSFFSRSAVS